VTSSQFAAIVRDELPFISKTLQRFGVPSLDIEDVAQEVLYGAYRASSRYDRSRAKLRTWLYRIALLQSKRFFARAHRRREVLAAPECFDLELIDDALDADQQLTREESRRIVQAAIDLIDARRRAVFVAHQLEGISIPKVARLLRLSKGTARGLLCRARVEFVRFFRRLQLRRGR
jgi:RNA polymerase sigma-70 factor (ECF subfamily)